MKPLLFCFLLFSGGVLRLSAQTDEALEFLKAEIQRTSQERDAAQKKLLQAETLSVEKVNVLRKEHADLQKRLNQRSRELLELEAGTRMSKAAMNRAERELLDREDQIQKLRQEQQRSRKAFEESTRQLSAKLAEAELKALKNTGPEGARLAEERERLRQEVRDQAQELLNLEAARQRDLTELHDLQNLNTQLSEDLAASRSSESLAKAKVAALESRLEILQQELANQYQERSELEQEQERLKEIIQDLEGRLADAEENRVPQAQYDEISSQLEQAQQENEVLRKDVKTLRKQNDSRRSNEISLETKLETLEEDLDRSEREKRQLVDETRQQQRQLKDERRIRAKLQREIASLEEIMQEAKAAGIQENDLEEVALLVAEMEREKEAFREEALRHRKNVDILQAELDSQNASQQAEIRQLQTMLNQQLTAITTSQRKISYLEAQTDTLDNVRKQKDQLVQIQKESRKDMRTLANHIYTLRRELVKNKETQRKAILAIQKNQELADELGSLRAEMDRIRQMNLSIQDHESGKEERMRDLRRELEMGRVRSQALELEKRQLQLELHKLRKAVLEGAP